MSNETLFFTQVGSILAFLITLFVLYRMLVQQKDGTIEFLKEQVQLLKTQMDTLKCEQPDILIETYTKRVQALENELGRLLAEKSSDKEHIDNLEERLREARSEVERIGSRIEKAHLVVRSYTTAKAIRKQLLDFYGEKCQVCGEGGARVVQVCHIRSIRDGGSSDISNLLCLCHNHHALFDQGQFSIAENMTLLGIEGTFERHPDHVIDQESLAYHRENIFEPNKAIQSDARSSRP